MELTALAIDVTALENAIASVDLSKSIPQDCGGFAYSYFQAKHADPAVQDALHFLTHLCSWSLRPDAPEQPFDSKWLPSNWQQLSTQQLEALESVAAAIGDEELRARACDILWLSRRSHTNARFASEAYIQSAERLCGLPLGVGMRTRLQRALQLSQMVGMEDGFHFRQLKRIEILASEERLDNLSLADCLGVLVEAKKSVDADKLYLLASNRAKSLSDQPDTAVWQHRFWEFAAAFAAIQGKSVERDAAIVEVAKTFEREAERAPLRAIAANRLKLALQHYRRVPGTEADRQRIQLAMLKAQEEMRSEMVPIYSGPIDTTLPAAAARDRVRGKSIAAAMAELVFATSWPTVEQLRHLAEESIHAHPLLRLGGVERLSSTGKTATITEGGSFGDEITDEELHSRMCWECRFIVSHEAISTIQPMRSELILGHSVQIDDVFEMLKHSDRIPQDRLAFFVIGIHAGIHGRFIEALHVLVPQLEHLIRREISEMVVTCKTNHQGIQREIDLNELLVMPEVEDYFGADLTFILRTLFIDKNGFNLRNELAHGMKSVAAYFDAEAVFSWWVILHIVGEGIAAFILSQPQFSANDGKVGVGEAI